MPAGRPTKYKPEFCQTVIDCGKDGMSKTEMAVECGVSWSTFHDWMDAHPEFRDAVKDAARQSQAWWERNGRLATFGQVDGFNATSYIFQMKNRFPDDWRDKQERELSGGLSINVVDGYPDPE